MGKNNCGLQPVDTRKNDVNRVEYYLRFVVTVQFSSTRTFNATSFDHRPVFFLPLFLLHFKPFRCYLMRFLLYDMSRCPHQWDSGRVVHLTWSSGYNSWGVAFLVSGKNRLQLHRIHFFLIYLQRGLLYLSTFDIG